jgi:hypothetical protein
MFKGCDLSWKLGLKDDGFREIVFPGFLSRPLLNYLDAKFVSLLHPKYVVANVLHSDYK